MIDVREWAEQNDAGTVDLIHVYGDDLERAVILTYDGEYIVWNFNGSGDPLAYGIRADRREAMDVFMRVVLRQVYQSANSKPPTITYMEENAVPYTSAGEIRD